MISYENFFEILKINGISQNEAIRKNIINARLLNALKHNKCITTDSINNLCNKLHCTPSDIISYKPDIIEETDCQNQARL
ncbi:MAG: helix-turn-helix domain-containing protein [Lachnospiraceae bacterium]|nr:helix-turn-helix domain-containing protein [Lachnospiraceae bacterium]